MNINNVGLTMIKELRDFFMTIDLSMKGSRIFKRQILHATAAHQPKLKKPLKFSKQEKITESVKSLPKP